MLTSSQKTAIKAAIDADPALSSKPLTADGADAIAKALNSITTFVVWRTDAPIESIHDQILWSVFTPQDAPDATALWSNRSHQCQSKQLNLTMLLSRTNGTINGSLPNVRAGLQDALTNIPSGALGATQAAGWTNVRLALQRFATRVEQILATGTGTQASPGNLTREGTITYQEVEEARAV